MPHRWTRKRGSHAENEPLELCIQPHKVLLDKEWINYLNDTSPLVRGIEKRKEEKSARGYTPLQSQ